MQFFTEFSQKLLIFQTDFLLKFDIAAVEKYANLVELEKCCQTHIFLQNFVLIQPRTSPPKLYKKIEKFANFANLPNPNRADARPQRRRLARRLQDSGFGIEVWPRIAAWHFAKFANFGGLVLGCIKTKFCKKICVWQHFSRSTRFAYFCTAVLLINFFLQKIGLKNK